jgi:hypothetical protein
MRSADRARLSLLKIKQLQLKTCSCFFICPKFAQKHNIFFNLISIGKKLGSIKSVFTSFFPSFNLLIFFSILRFSDFSDVFGQFSFKFQPHFAIFHDFSPKMKQPFRGF